MRTLVLILDGTCWDCLPAESSPFLNGMEFKGELYSPIPVTVPAFVNIFTGHWPDQHGLHSFTRIDGSIRTVQDKSAATPYVWEKLAAKGLSVAVVNMPMTYPITSLDNLRFMVTGFDAPFPGAKNTIYPANLCLGKYVGDVLHLIKVDPNTEQDIVNKAFLLQTAINVCSARTECVIRWYRQYGADVLFMNLPEFDRVAHFCFRHREMMNIIVEHIDRQVRCLWEIFSPAHLLICSDHGFADSLDQSQNSRYYRHVFRPLGPNMEGVHSQTGIVAGINVNGAEIPNDMRQTDIAGIITRLSS